MTGTFKSKRFFSDILLKKYSHRWTIQKTQFKSDRQTGQTKMPVIKSKLCGLLILLIIEKGFFLAFQFFSLSINDDLNVLSIS